MADVIITRTDIKKYNEPGTMVSTNTIPAGDTGVIRADFNDAKTIIVFAGLSAGKATIHVNPKSFMGRLKDIEVEVDPVDSQAISIESGPYVQTEGDYKGCIIFDTDVEILVMVIQTPIP